MQFRAAVEGFLRSCVIERQLSEHTLRAYTSDLGDFEKWLPACILVSEITPASLKHYLEEMVTQRNLRPATVRRRLACLRVFFRRLRGLGEAQDPFASWRPSFARMKRLPRALSRREVSLLLFSLRDPETGILETILRVMVATGVRVGELCRVRIEDISPDASMIRIDGKGSRDRIAYVANAELRRQLQQLIRTRQMSDHPVGALFVNRHGSPIRPQSIRSKLRRHAKEAGLTLRVTPHILRHTSATLLIEAGVDIRFVQRLLGHSSIATTEIYTHVSDEALRTTLERADVLGMLAQR